MRLGRWVPRLILGVTVIGVLGVIVIISLGERDPDRVELTGAGDVQRIYGGIPQESAYVGPTNAPVTVSVFNDLQAPTGASYQLETVDPLIEGYARTGEARFELRHFSFTSHQTNLAAYAAVAAGEQGRAWQYADLFFRNQDEAPAGEVTERFLREIANGVPELDAERWEEDLEAAAVQARVEGDAALAADLRLPAAPAVLITGESGSRELRDGPSLGEIEAAIAALE
jgi:protein-disulfide isomerase